MLLKVLCFIQTHWPHKGSVAMDMKLYCSVLEQLEVENGVLDSVRVVWYYR